MLREGVQRGHLPDVLGVHGEEVLSREDGIADRNMAVVRGPMQRRPPRLVRLVGVCLVSVRGGPARPQTEPATTPSDPGSTLDVPQSNRKSTLKWPQLDPKLTPTRPRIDRQAAPALGLGHMLVVAIAMAPQGVALSTQNIALASASMQSS